MVAMLAEIGLWLFLMLAVVAAGWGWSRGLRACESANEVDWGGPWLNRLDGLNRLYCRRFHRLNSDLLPLPPQGGVLVAANHVSGLDPLLLVAASPRPLRFLIAREQYQRFGLKKLCQAMGCIPVDRSGRPEKALRQALLALRAGEAVVIFPQGGIHLDTDPPRPLKKGIAWLAARSGVSVYGVHIEGVKGEGRILGAVLLRSRVFLRYRSPISCLSLSQEECLALVAQTIRGGREEEIS
ncbi:phospholipid/glycerol acyltransferase [Nitrosococcus watsonii C-113]|uniref:Phospholipid/glycerol acyltransferase n=2 Tax=Nitrosococcus TaxID=1227 RepID=D8K8E0_NITWC|nr:phospholipid/glycerol acyltransferase [Nitrosococcus watsonii C-113]